MPIRRLVLGSLVAVALSVPFGGMEGVRAGLSAQGPSSRVGSRQAAPPPQLRTASTATRPVEAAPSSALHASSAVAMNSPSAFAVVGSFRTAKGAMEHLRNLRERHMSLDLAVYPPYYRSGYWTVVSAAYSTPAEADQHVKFFRSSRLQVDAYVRELRRPSRRSYDVYAPSIALPTYPDLIRPPSPASMVESSHFVFVATSPDENGAGQVAEDIRRRYPGLKIAVFGPRPNSSVWGVALAAHASAEQAAKAQQLARRLNLVETATTVVIPASEASTWRASDRVLMSEARAFRERVESCFRDGSVTISDMRACADAWVTPDVLNACIGTSNAAGDNLPSLAEAEACVALPDTAEGARVLAQLGFTPATVLVLKASNYLSLNGTDIANCVADAKGNSQALQKCLLPKLFSPQQKTIADCTAKSDAQAVTTCILAATAESDKTGVAKCMESTDRSLNAIAMCLKGDDQAALLRMAAFQGCTSSATTQKEFLSKCVGPLQGPNRAVVQCAAQAGGDPQKVKECAVEQFPNGRDVVALAECSAAAGKDPEKLSKCLIKGDIGGVGAAIAACTAGAAASANALATCLANLDPKFKVAQDLRKCVASAVDDPAAAIRLCAKDVLQPDSQKLAVCLLTAGGDPLAALSACGGTPAESARVVETVACLQRVGNATDDLARCLLIDRPNTSAALEATVCASRSSGDPAKLALCAAPHLGGPAGEVAACLAAQPASRRDPARCVGAADPRLADAQKVYNCLSRGKDAAALISGCSEGILDDKTRQAATCVASANGDRTALAACAGQAVLPGEAGRLVGCAASSQGPTSFGVCAVAPGMNEEFRIAAECAVSSGGEPISFASCTGGRLTIRELTKCIGGEVGKDCFGPNNTIRKYYETMFNDLTKGPGPNNDILVAVRTAGKALEDVGKGVEHVVNEVKKQAEEAVNRAKERLSNPTKDPGATVVCVVTLFTKC